MFEMILEMPKTTATIDVDTQGYDPEIDDVGSVLRDICEILERVRARFVVRICSNELWPATVRTDLLVILEQIADVIASLAKDLPTTLDFYEQGIEQIVRLEPAGEVLKIKRCHIVAPAIVVASTAVPKEVVVDMLCKLVTDFISASASHGGHLPFIPGLLPGRAALSKS